MIIKYATPGLKEGFSFVTNQGTLFLIEGDIAGSPFSKSKIGEEDYLEVYMDDRRAIVVSRRRRRLSLSIVRINRDGDPTHWDYVWEHDRDIDPTNWQALAAGYLLTDSINGYPSFTKAIRVELRPIVNRLVKPTLKSPVNLNVFPTRCNITIKEGIYSITNGDSKPFITADPQNFNMDNLMHYIC